MNKQQLASKIWESANKMRSKIEANEYKDYILGFIFYKFLSDKELKYLKENDWTDEYLPELTEEDEETVRSIQQNIGYFISYKNLFSTWIEKGSDFNAGDVTDALQAFNRLINDAHKKVFEGIFQTLETGLSKLGETSGARTKAIRDLIYLIDDIPMDGKQDYDVLGFIYEYLISNFAANAGKKAGEFYTPHEVSLLMSEIVAEHLKDRNKIEIYDPTSGSGSLLINIGKSVSKYMTGENKIKYYAQELKENTYNLTRMNLVMRGILPDNIVTRNGDTLEDDWPYFDDNDRENTYSPLFVDAVVSNPPYSQAWDPANKDSDSRFESYGLAPKSKADYAFLLHDLFHLKNDGIMTIVLPHGVLFRGGEEGNIRKNLIEKNNIDTIIGLPANIFFGTGIPTIIMVLKKNRPTTDILIIDASKGFKKEGKNNVLRSSDIKKIADTVATRKTIPKYSKVVTRDEIRSNDYNLNIPRYVDSSEKAESWDIYSLMFGGIPENEINDLDEYWKAFPTLKDSLFEKVEGSNYHIKEKNIKEALLLHPDIKYFEENFISNFDGYEDYLKHELIDNMLNINAAKEENILSDDLFSRLKDIPLVDHYEAYQILDDDWNKISSDLEILQTEGIEALKGVDPNMVLKKKDNKDQEIQEGWKGHILPFSLVQEELLQTELSSLKEKENRLNEISSSYSELIENLPEEEKEKEYIKEDSFVAKEVKKALKDDSLDKEVIDTLKKAQSLMNEEDLLKKKVKQETIDLHLKTKEIIENLSDEEAFNLVNKKWITPYLENIKSLSKNIIHNFETKLENLSKKYETTIPDLEKEIKETEKELRSLLDQLSGSAEDMKGIEEFKKVLGGNE